MTTAKSRSVIEVCCHRSRGGPFTGGAALLRAVVPDLLRSDPTLVAEQAGVILAVAPDLATQVPRPVETLTAAAPLEERTRYYSSARPRFLSRGVARLLDIWVNNGGRGPVTISFLNTAHADPTDIALIEILVRCQRGQLEVVQRDSEVDEHTALDTRTFIDADGTLAPPPDYLAMESSERRRLHTERAELLSFNPIPGANLGAIPYHLERGLDPAGAGADALRHVLEYSFNEGFYDSAVDAARRGLDVVDALQRSDLAARFNLRMIAALSSLNRVQEALERVHAYRGKSISANDQMQCCYLLAMLLTRQRGYARPQEALAWANTAIALADSSANLGLRAFNGAFMRNARALVELHLGHPEIALRFVQDAIELTNRHLEPHEHLLHRTVLIHNRARVSLVLGDLESALADLSTVVKRDPQFEDAVFDRARAYTALGDLPSAIADYTRAIDLRDTFVEALHNRGELYMELHQDDCALIDFDAVLSLEADHIPALANRASVYLRAGELVLAESDLTRGVELEPANTDLLCAMGTLNEERGKFDVAIAWYHRALAENPECVPALADWAILEFSAGHFTNAVAHLDRAIAVERTPTLLCNRGIVHHAVGNHVAALADFDAALRGGGDTTEILYRRGATRLALGDRSGAVADWRAHLANLISGESSQYADEIEPLLALRRPEGWE